MKNHDLIPLAVGDLALRFRFGWSGTRNPERGGAAVPVVTGLEVCEVVATHGEFVTWTNHKPARKGAAEKFYHTSPREELIALAWLDNLSAAPAENPAVPNTALPA